MKILKNFNRLYDINVAKIWDYFQDGFSVFDSTPIFDESFSEENKKIFATLQN